MVHLLKTRIKILSFIHADILYGPLGLSINKSIEKLYNNVLKTVATDIRDTHNNKASRIRRIDKPINEFTNNQSVIYSFVQVNLPNWTLNYLFVFFRWHHKIVY
jgi:hypothetical protein